jgi:hypothetical protein
VQVRLTQASLVRALMPITTLPNGLVLETPTENEAKVIYEQLFESNAYLRNGITLHDGATVFDVGAHVGGFSASLVQHHRDLRLFLSSRSGRPSPFSNAMPSACARRPTSSRSMPRSRRRPGGFASASTRRQPLSRAR